MKVEPPKLYIQFGVNVRWFQSFILKTVPTVGCSEKAVETLELLETTV